ncbi:hypothetical protein VPH35_043628 [Triticum aestivum]
MCKCTLLERPSATRRPNATRPPPASVLPSTTRPPRASVLPSTTTLKTPSLAHTIWILLETGNNFKATCHKVSLNALSQLVAIALETSWMDRAPQMDMGRRLMETLREDKFAKKAPAHTERRGCYYTTIPLRFGIYNKVNRQWLAIRIISCPITQKL